MCTSPATHMHSSKRHCWAVNNRTVTVCSSIPQASAEEKKNTTAPPDSEFLQMTSPTNPSHQGEDGSHLYALRLGSVITAGDCVWGLLHTFENEVQKYRAWRMFKLTSRELHPAELLTNFQKKKNLHQQSCVFPCFDVLSPWKGIREGAPPFVSIWIRKGASRVGDKWLVSHSPWVGNWRWYSWDAALSKVSAESRALLLHLQKDWHQQRKILVSYSSLHFP